MFWWILLIGLIAVLFGAFVYSLCRVAGCADDMMEAQLKAMRSRQVRR